MKRARRGGRGKNRGAPFNRLERLLLERQMTQQQLADRCGVHRTHLISIMRRRKEPGIIVCLKIAKALRVEVERIWPNIRLE